MPSPGELRVRFVTMISPFPFHSGYSSTSLVEKILEAVSLPRLSFVVVIFEKLPGYSVAFEDQVALQSAGSNFIPSAQLYFVEVIIDFFQGINFETTLNGIVAGTCGEDHIERFRFEGAYDFFTSPEIEGTGLLLHCRNEIVHNTFTALFGLCLSIRFDKFIVNYDTSNEEDENRCNQAYFLSTNGIIIITGGFAIYGGAISRRFSARSEPERAGRRTATSTSTSSSSSLGQSSSDKAQRNQHQQQQTFLLEKYHRFILNDLELHILSSLIIKSTNHHLQDRTHISALR